MKNVFALLIFALSLSAQAQTSSTKKDLLIKILKLQQPAVEAFARGLAEQPAVQLSQQAGMALQARISPEKREGVAKEIQTDLKKYVDEVTPIVREHALKLLPSTMGSLLDERFSEDELKQLLAIMESPVNRKFMQMGGEMQKSLGEKLVTETRSLVEPKAKVLEQSISKRLGLPAKSGTSPAKPAGK